MAWILVIMFAIVTPDSEDHIFRMMFEHPNEQSCTDEMTKYQSFRFETPHANLYITAECYPKAPEFYDEFEEAPEAKDTKT